MLTTIHVYTAGQQHPPKPDHPRSHQQSTSKPPPPSTTTSRNSAPKSSHKPMSFVKAGEGPPSKPQPSLRKLQNQMDDDDDDDEDDVSNVCSGLRYNAHLGFILTT